jgi:anaphase-promoting complex subunit 4
MPKAEDLVPIPKLALVCEKKLPAKCKPSTLTYCPSMDLIALASADERVHVFRFNGQEALGGPFVAKNGVSVCATRWKGDGELRGTGFSDLRLGLLADRGY